MFIQMLGIDYEKAGVDVRSVFSFQNHEVKDSLTYLKNTYNLSGVILISTCNRTELYISSVKKCNIKEIFCSLKEVKCCDYEKYFVIRENEAAIRHIFMVACGMKSKVFGEDQIITQVKNSLSVARERETTDYQLEKLFQNAITAAKKIKTELRLTAVQASVITEMNNALIGELGSIKNKKCMVIGNGEIGRLAAEAMVKNGADVTVTVRDYKTGNASVPFGCKKVDYHKRYDVIANFDIIISATASPHYTVKYSECSDIFRDGVHRILIDLAVPRDISPQFEKEDNISLYNIDSFGGVSTSAKDNKAVELAMRIIQEYEDKLRQEQLIKENIEVIKNIGELGGELSYFRIKKELEKSDSDDMQRLIMQGASKTISAILFDIQKNLPPEYFKACLNAIKEDMVSKRRGGV